MKNNKGFTLLELLVVIAIIGILLGAMTYSVNSVSGTRAKKFASDLSALVSQCRIDTMSGAPTPTYLKLYQADNGDYYGVLYEGGSTDTYIKASRKLGGGGIDCTFKTDVGSSYSVGGNYKTSLCLAFDRSNGAFQKLVIIPGQSATITGDFCTSITAASGSGRYVVTLVPETGYHSVGR